MSENEEQEKAAKGKFFALYFGQSVLHYSQADKCGHRLYSTEQFWGDKDSFLMLSDYKNILDVHAVELAIQNKFTIGNNEAKIRVAKDILRRIFETKQNQNKSCLPFESADYLRANGYALPFNGYNIPQLIEKGWLKLKEQP